MLTKGAVLCLFSVGMKVLPGQSCVNIFHADSEETQGIHLNKLRRLTVWNCCWTFENLRAITPLRLPEPELEAARREHPAEQLVLSPYLGSWLNQRRTDEKSQSQNGHEDCDLG